MKKVTILFSGSASSIRYLIQNDPSYGVTYVFVGAVTNDKNASAIAFFAEQGIPCIMLDRKDWVRESGVDKKEWRKMYFAELEKIIQDTFNPDFIILSGFMLLVPSFFCDAFFIINVHPADLSIVDSVSGKRKYIGDNAVTLAIEAGEKETHSTIHQVTAETDGGPIITMSQPLAVIAGRPPKEHQEEMKWKCDGPAMQVAVGMIVSGKYKKQNS